MATDMMCGELAGNLFDEILQGMVSEMAWMIIH
jgi:hypothetical protein